MSNTERFAREIGKQYVSFRPWPHDGNGSPVEAPVGRKDDSSKPRLELLPPRAIELVGDVLAHGAGKYGVNNWVHVENGRGRYLAATLRHVFARLRGERLDPESGKPHLAHAVCSLLFVLEKFDE